MYGGTIKGLVVALEGRPIKDVAILVDGVEKAVTNKEGIYELNFEKVPGSYTIDVKHPSYNFGSTSVVIDLKTRELPEIQAESTLICGTVKVHDENMQHVPGSQERWVYC